MADFSIDKGDVQHAIAYLKALGWSDMRKWSEFGKNWPDVPDMKWSSLEKRTATNFVYYKTNYLYIALGVCAYTLLTNWALLFATLLTAATWLYVLEVRRAPIVLGKRVLSWGEKVGALFGASFIILWLFGSVIAFFWMVSLSVAVIGLHMLLRKPNLKSKMVKLRSDITVGSFDEEDVDVEAGGAAGGDGDDAEAGSMRQRKEDYAERKRRLIESTTTAKRRD